MSNLTTYLLRQKRWRKYWYKKKYWATLYINCWATVALLTNHKRNNFTSVNLKLTNEATWKTELIEHTQSNRSKVKNWLMRLLFLALFFSLSLVTYNLSCLATAILHYVNLHLWCSSTTLKCTWLVVVWHCKFHKIFFPLLHYIYCSLVLYTMYEFFFHK